MFAPPTIYSSKGAPTFEVEVRTVSGSSQRIPADEQMTFGEFVVAASQAFALPPFRLRFALDDIALLDGVHQASLLEVGIVPGRIVTMAVLSSGWYWADMSGEPLWVRNFKAKTTYSWRNYYDLSDLMPKGNCVKDTGSGVVYVDACAEFPATAEAVLQFLLGSEDTHEPVLLPEDAMDPEPGWESVPWRDIAALVPLTGGLADAWDHHVRRDVGWAAAARALACAGPDAGDAELEAFHRACRFYTLEGVHPDAQDYFEANDECHRRCLIICANQRKRTLAFSFMFEFVD
uniref:Ubiquitin-like domain-containing protein n=1 Tax=Zooxanthella nutricula TaxID=1333877 RepID=A0A6U6GF66_9DINO|mmetsp:Transcript_102589/g.313723  ORF Transcript_102589/g.313723 Transcript_102589/m.313723 type:complete len:290 (+) Transcript_102589:112-981(+)